MPRRTHIAACSLIPTPATERRFTAHDFCELIYVVRGQYQVKVAGETWSGEEGSVYFYPAGVRHLPRPIEDLSCRLIEVHWRDPSPNAPWHRPFQTTDARRRLLAVLTWMCEPLVDTSRRAKVLHALLSTAVLEIEQLLDEQILPQDGVAQVASLIERFPGHPFSLDMLAQSVSMEPHLLIKRFKAAYGVTPMKHLRHIRLQKALSLLHSTTLPLGEIAKRVGWRSGFYLSAEMKRHFGRTPRDLRRIRGT